MFYIWYAVVYSVLSFIAKFWKQILMVLGVIYILQLVGLQKPLQRFLKEGYQIVAQKVSNPGRFKLGKSKSMVNTDADADEGYYKVRTDQGYKKFNIAGKEVEEVKEQPKRETLIW